MNLGQYFINVNLLLKSCLSFKMVNELPDNFSSSDFLANFAHMKKRLKGRFQTSIFVFHQAFSHVHNYLIIDHFKC